ncbi:MAG: carbon monoxide dehydrogenase subunit G [Candidatus Bathyarchaeia archaeon]
MHLEGTYILNRPREEVWQFISKPEEIAKCLPDLQSLEVKDSKTFTVSVKVGIAFVRGSFKFDFTLLDQKPPSHSKFEAVGKGAGVSVRLTASMDLNEIDAGTTELAWKTDAELGGLLGEISPSLIQNSTNKFTMQFFDCVKSKLESTK